MKKISLLLLPLLLLAACGSPNEEDIYEDVVSILEVDLPAEGILPSDFSSQEMTEFKDLGDGMYEVNGNVHTTFEGVFSYSMKIKYDGDEYVEYEWTAE